MGGKLSYITKNGSWLIALQVVASLSGLLSSVVLTRYLTTDEFGIYRFLLTIVAIATLATLPGLNSAIIRGVSRYGTLALQPLMRTKLHWSAGGSGLLLIVFGYYWWQGSNDIAIGLLILAATLPLLERYAIYIPYRKGSEDFTTTSHDLMVTKLVQVTAVIAAATITNDALVTFAALLVSKILTNRLYFFWRKPITEPYSDATTEAITFGKKLTATQILITLSNQIDKLCIWYFTTAATLAYYAVAFLIPSTLQGFIGFLPQLALPRFAKQNWRQQNVMRTYVRRISMLALILSGLYVLYIVTVPHIFHWLFPTYQTALGAAMILGSMIVLQPIRLLGEQMFIAQERSLPLVVISVIEITVFVSSFIALYMIYGDNLTMLALAFPLKILAAICVQIIYAGITLRHNLQKS